MSSSGNATPATVPAPVDPVAASLQSNLRSLAVLVGGLLAAHGVVGPNGTITPERWEFIVGLVITLAPFAYSWYEKFKAAKDSKSREAVAVEAGINLVARGAALATDGSLIASASSAPPLPVTVQSAQAIITNFGPKTKPLSTDDLNEMSLKAAKGA